MTDASTDLIELGAFLVARLEALRTASERSAESRRPVQLDQASVGRLSRIDAMQMQAMALATERNRHVKARRIEATIRRIDDGDYGYCVACREEIGPRRLAADPTIPACIRCASGTDRSR